MTEEMKRGNTVSALVARYSGELSQIECECLLSFALSVKREDLYLGDYVVDVEAEKRYKSFINRRKAFVPLEHITGKAEFMGMEFIVSKDVLIPRPETELLIKCVTELPEKFLSDPRLSVMDLGTGSGNIAVSVAGTLPKARVSALDISGKALAIARKNADIHGVSERIEFYKGDMFEALPFDKIRKFDIMLCNPPYVKKEDMLSLQHEVRQEPVIALDGGSDGLDFYRGLAKMSRFYVKKGGYLFLETGQGQSEGVKEIFSRFKDYKLINIKKDFSGIERIIGLNIKS